MAGPPHRGVPLRALFLASSSFAWLGYHTTNPLTRLEKGVVQGGKIDAAARKYGLKVCGSPNTMAE